MKLSIPFVERKEEISLELGERPGLKRKQYTQLITNESNLKKQNEIWIPLWPVHLF